MKIQLNKLREALPTGDLGGALSLPDAARGGGPLGPGADVDGIDLRREALEGDDLSGARLLRPVLEGARLSGVDLSHAELAHARMAGAHLTDCDLSEARLTIVDAEGAVIRGGSLHGARITGARLSRATLADVDLSEAEVTVSDCFGCELSGITARGARLRGVDLSYSALKGVDLGDADLRGCALAWCTFDGVNLEGARLDGADLRGARGLTAEQRAQLRAQGARLTAGWLEARVVALLRRAAPGMGAERAEGLARGVGIALQAAVVLGALALTLALFRDRVVPPQDLLSEEGASAPLVREPTEKELEQTRANLATLRAAIQAAYDTSGRYGVAQYPRIDDLADNVYDRDGAGPGVDRVPLVEGGLPKNLLTQGEAVLPYCNDTAAQETLSGDDSDWHYCEDTGRIYACGGFTDAPTLSW